MAGGSFVPALVMGIWWKRANRAHAYWSMITGYLVTAYYMSASRVYRLAW